ncbi:unnamed protein product [Merluccius merluccius]
MSTGFGGDTEGVNAVGRGHRKHRLADVSGSDTAASDPTPPRHIQHRRVTSNTAASDPTPPRQTQHRRTLISPSNARRNAAPQIGRPKNKNNNRRNGRRAAKGSPLRFPPC